VSSSWIITEEVHSFRVLDEFLCNAVKKEDLKHFDNMKIVIYIISIFSSLQLFINLISYVYESEEGFGF
jgi:hypothetical protein